MVRLQSMIFPDGSVTMIASGMLLKIFSILVMNCSKRKPRELAFLVAIFRVACAAFSVPDTEASVAHSKAETRLEKAVSRE